MKLYLIAYSEDQEFVPSNVLLSEYSPREANFETFLMFPIVDTVCSYLTVLSGIDKGDDERDFCKGQYEAESFMIHNYLLWYIVLHCSPYRTEKSKKSSSIRSKLQSEWNNYCKMIDSYYHVSFACACPLNTCAQISFGFLYFEMDKCTLTSFFLSHKIQRVSNT